MKAQIRHVQDGEDLYDAIVVWCPGCDLALRWGDREQGAGLHMLPVTGTDEKRPVWGWNGELESVTLTPSIKTGPMSYGEITDFVCHSYLRDGVWEFLMDSTHELAGQKVPMVDLPDWVVKED